MAAIKLLGLIAVVSLALLGSSLTTPVNALSSAHGHLNRQVAHEGIARRNSSKRSNNKRCKPKPTSSSASLPSVTVAVQATAKVTHTSSSSKAPAAASPSPTPAKSSGSSSSSTGRQILGIGWNGGNSNSLALCAGPNTKFVYDWSPWKPEDTYGLTFVPMLWGSKQVDDFENNVKATTNPGYLLGMNEPDNAGQSSLSPSDAVSLWWAHMEPKIELGYTLISPAPTGSPAGKQWMKEFLAACSECHITVAAVHIYENNAQSAIDFLTDYHNTVNMGIWVTEMACQDFSGKNDQCSQDQAWAFWTTIMAWAASTDWIEQIMPFAFLEDMGNVATTNQALSGGKLTALGQYFVNGNF